MTYLSPSDGPKPTGRQDEEMDFDAGKHIRNKHLTEGHLRRVLLAAWNQVISGKGDERHGKGQFLDEQQWVNLARHHGIGFLTGQAAKKLNETPGLQTKDARIRELQGAIAYAAFAIMMEEVQDDSGVEEALKKAADTIVPFRIKDHGYDPRRPGRDLGT